MGESGEERILPVFQFEITFNPQAGGIALLSIE
jgi:hypothetical protein